MLRPARRAGESDREGRADASTSIPQPDAASWSIPKLTSTFDASCVAAARSIVGAYHSHPLSPAEPSASDVAEASYPDFVHLIVSLLPPAPEVRAYRIARGIVIGVAADAMSRNGRGHDKVEHAIIDCLRRVLGGRARTGPIGDRFVNPNPICDFGIDKDALQYIGHDLQRPECILAEPDGTLWSADARGGVVRIAPDGTQQIVTQSSPDISRAPAARPPAISRARCRTASPSPATAIS